MAIEWRALVAMALLGACSDEPSRVVDFADLEEGAVIGGLQRTSVETDVPSGALRVDLFLDGERIGSAEAAPFAVEWDTTAFDEGPHELRARVEATDGQADDVALGVVVDNTPPVIAPIPDTIVVDRVLDLLVIDEHEIVSVELDGGSFRESWTGLPASLVWPDGCAVRDVTITATDEAGWSSSITSAVESYRSDDHDCDDFLTIEAEGGTDCDDQDAAVHPGVLDLGPLGDVNCDGVPGMDRDGDGVAALGEGGRDCDDLDPRIHPDAAIYAGSEPLEIGGEPVTWEPGTAAASAGSTRQGTPIGDLAINRDGTLELLTIGVNTADVLSRTQLLTGINPGAVHLARTSDDVLHVVYGRGLEIRDHVRRDGVWTDELVLVAAGDIDAVAADVTGSGAGVLVRVGTALQLATNDGEGWQSRPVAPEADVAPAPMAVRVRGNGVVDVAYVVDGALRMARSIDLGDPGVTELGPVADPAAMIGLCLAPEDDAAYYADGGCLVRTGDRAGPVVEPCGAPIERLFCLGEAVAFQPSQGVVGLFEDGLVEYIDVEGADVAGRLQVTGAHVFAAPGAFFGRDRYARFLTDPVDGVDRDCDGLD